MERCNIMHPDIKPRAADKKDYRASNHRETDRWRYCGLFGCVSGGAPGDVIVIDAFGEIETSIWGG